MPLQNWKSSQQIIQAIAGLQWQFKKCSLLHYMQHGTMRKFENKTGKEIEYIEPYAVPLIIWNYNYKKSVVVWH